MFSCRQISELVTDYLERAVTTRQRFQFWIHVALCPDCRRHVNKMTEMITALSQIQSSDTPPQACIEKLGLRPTKKENPVKTT